MANQLSDIDRYKRVVERELSEIFQRERRSAHAVDPLARDLIAVIEEFVQRGSCKRIRAWLVKVGYEATGRRAPAALRRVSAAVEIFHSSMLMHDDVIDRDAIRRGGWSVHETYRRRFGDPHVGVSLAILTGNVARNLSQETLLSTSFPKARLDRVNAYFHLLDRLTNYGEALDVALSVAPAPTVSAILRMLQYKTAHYSFAGPLLIGARLAGGSARLQRELQQFAHPAGIAFQIQDDLLGAFGSTRQLGKPAGSDLREGKRTLLYLFALEKSSVRDRAWLRRRYGSEALSTADLQRVRDIFTRSGAVQQTRKFGERYLDRARSALRQSRAIVPAKRDELLRLCDLLQKRTT